MDRTLSPASRRERTTHLVLDAMLVAILLVLQLTPLGYIPIPGFNPTTMHIPVIVGAILLGPADGAFLGLVFGITSIIQATVQVPLTGFLFSPFVPFGSYKSAIIAIVPRVLLGLVAAWVYRALRRVDHRGAASAAVAAVAGSLTNTVLVLGGVFVLMRGEYIQQLKVPAAAVAKVLGGVVLTSGLAEAAVGAIAVTAVVQAVLALRKRHRH